MKTTIIILEEDAKHIEQAALLENIKVEIQSTDDMFSKVIVEHRYNFELYFLGSRTQSLKLNPL